MQNFYVTRTGCDENSCMQSWPRWLRLETTSFWQCGSKHMHSTLKYYLIDPIINMLTWCNRCIFALRIQAQPLCKCALPWTLANEWIQASFTRALKTNNDGCVGCRGVMDRASASYSHGVKGPGFTSPRRQNYIIVICLTIIYGGGCWCAKP